MDERGKMPREHVGTGTPSKEELVASYRYLASILESMLDAVVVANPDGTIRTVNRAALELLGYSEGELMGQPVGTIFEEEEEEAAAFFRGTGLAKLVHEGAARDVELTLLTKSGERIPVVFNGSVIREEDGHLSAVVGVARDIRERKRAEEETRQHTAQLEALRQVGMELSVELDLDNLLRSIVSRAVELLGGNSGAIDLYRPDIDVLEWVASVGMEHPSPKPFLRRGEGLCGKVWESGEPLIVDDYHRWEGRVPGWEGYPFQAVMGVPVRWGEEFLGVLQVSAAPPRTFSPADAELLSLFAHQAAIAIRNARLYEQARKLAERLTVVNHIARAVGTTLDLDDLMETAYREVTSVFEADAFFIALYAPPSPPKLGGEGGGELDYRLRVDEGIREPPQRQSIGTGLTSLVVAEKKPLLIRNLEQELDRLPTPRVWGTMKLPASWLGVPMLIGERLIGVICVQAYRPHAYGEEEQQLLSTIADQVAVAIENARLYEEEKRRATQLAMINEVGDLAASILDLDRLMQEVARSIQESFNYYNVALLLLNEQRQELVMQAMAGGFEHIAPGEYRQSLDEGIMGFVARTGQSWLARDISKDPHYVKGFLGEVLTRSELCVPIKLDDEVIGALDVQSIRLNDFDQLDVVAMEAVADRLAIAIQNARLFEETQRRARQLQTVEEVGRKASAILDLDELFPYVVKAIQQNFGYYHADILLVDQPTGYAVFKASSDPALEKAWKEQDLRFKIGEEGLIGWVAHTGEPLLANDVSQEPRYLADELLPHTRSELVVPLKVGERVVGVLDVDSEELNAFDQDDVFALQTLANQIAIAIENARLYEAEQRRRQEAETLRQTALALTSALDRNQVVERILSQLQQVVPYDSASVQLLQGDRLVITGGRGFPNLEELRGISFPVDGDNPNREVMRTLAPLIVEDAPAVYEGFRQGPHVQSVIRSWLGVPMLIGQRPVGMIALDKQEPGFYTQEHARLAQTFAAQAAVAVENARLFEEVERRRVYLEGVLGSAPDAIVTLDAQHRIVEWNPGAERLFGYSAEEVMGQNLDDLITNPDVLEEAVGFSRMAMSGKDVPPTETVRYRKDGSPVDVILAGSPILVGDELIGVVAVYTDITARVRMEEELRAMALVDDLTGLHNRRGFFTLAGQQLRTAHRMKWRMLLLFADFNGLKLINDTFGHPAGDQALIEVAEVLGETFRESDIIARIAGDEFVVLALETDGDSAEIIAARLQENLEARNARPGRRYKLSLSVGVARYDPENPCSIDELITQADRAMYEKKRREQG